MTEPLLRVAFVGSRNFRPLSLVREAVEALGPFHLISGGATGVDSVAEQEAKRLGNQCTIYYPSWGKHGRGAGHIRNTAIIDDSEAACVLWDGKSRGTLDSYVKASKKGIPIMSICSSHDNLSVSLENYHGRGSSELRVLAKEIARRHPDCVREPKAIREG